MRSFITSFMPGCTHANLEKGSTCPLCGRVVAEIKPSRAYRIAVYTVAIAAVVSLVFSAYPHRNAIFMAGYILSSTIEAVLVFIYIFRFRKT